MTPFPVAPEIRAMAPNLAGRQWLVDAFATVNRRLSSLSAREGLPFSDFDVTLQAELQRRIDIDGRLNVDGVRMIVRARGISPPLTSSRPVARPGAALSARSANA
jgi:hypothetical protein